MEALERAKRAARGITREFCVTKPSDITLDAFAAWKRVFAREDKLTGCDARLLMNQKANTGLATINSDIPEAGRKRFALAHEIGHFELHRNIKRHWQCTEVDFLKWYKSTEEEPEANAFAAELLMPEEIFISVSRGMSPGFNAIRQLADAFNTTLTASAIRYAEIGNHPCALFSSKDGKISWFRVSPDFPYKVATPKSLIEEASCAGAFFANKSLPDRPQIVPDYCWLDFTGPAGRIKVFEELIPMRRYGIALSLVWTL